MSDRFRTKTGHVEVHEDRLVVERTGVRGNLAQRLQGRSTQRTWLVYGLLGLLLAWNAWHAYASGHTLVAVLDVALLAWIVHALWRVRDFTMTPVIPRDRTHKVEGIRGVWGLTRDRVVVHFEEDGRPVRRFVLMPGVLQRGAGELDRALQLLEAHGWPVA